MKAVNGIALPEEALELETGNTTDGTPYVMWCLPCRQPYKGERAVIMQVSKLVGETRGLFFTESAIRKMLRLLEETN